jgi:hypothetical protein
MNAAANRLSERGEESWFFLVVKNGPDFLFAPGMTVVVSFFLSPASR